MSSFDLKSSFWQIPFAKESRKYTAFQFEGRTYEFNVVPFGLKTSVAALVRGLERVIRYVPRTVTYIDDILCLAEDVPEHLRQVESLLRCLSENNLTLNFEKTQFCRDEVDFLGFVITPRGLQAQPDKLAVIRDFRPPKNIKQLRGFLGFINFYAKFAKNYAQETTPLLPLIRKGARCNWTEEHQEAFDRIKNLFLEVITLANPDPRKPFIVTTDASDFAIGATLSQWNNEGDEEVISFISRTLKGAEIN